MKTHLRIAVLILSIVIGLSSCNQAENPIQTTTEHYITRGEWISILSEGFNLDEYNSTTPLYSDVTVDNILFPKVQAMAERGILSTYTEDKLEVGKLITRDEVASTAAIAAGFEANEKGEYDVDAAISYAVKYGIIDGNSAGYLTEDECNAVIEAAQNIYMTNPGEEKMIAIFNENLVVVNGIPSSSVHMEATKVHFSPAMSRGISTDSNGNKIALLDTKDGRIALNAGDTFVCTPTQESIGIAFRIYDIEESANGAITLIGEAPAFGDIYDQVDIHTTVSLEDGFIEWADGVEIISTEPEQLSADTGNYHVELLSDRSVGGHRPDPFTDDGSPVTFHIDRGDGPDRTWKVQNSTILGDGAEIQALESSNFVYTDSPSIDDFKGSTETWTKDLDKKEKYSPGRFKLEGDISIKVEAVVDLDYYKLNFFNKEIDHWPRSVSVILNSDITTDLKLTGNLLTKEFTIGKITIPIGETGLFIDGNLILYVDASGEINIKIEYRNSQRTGWTANEKWQGYQPPIRRARGQGDTATAEVQGSIDLSSGAIVKVELSAFSVIKVVGIEVKAGGDLESKASLTGECEEETKDGTVTRHYKESIKLGSTFYIPIVELTATIPDRLSDILDLKMSWEIIDKDKAAKIPFKEAEWVIWEAIAILNSNGEITSLEEITAEPSNVEPDNLDIGQLLLGDFSSIAGTYTADAVYAQNYGFSSCPDIVITEDGIVTGGGLTSYGYTQKYAGTVPFFISSGENEGWGAGTILCRIESIPGTFDPVIGMEEGGYAEFYVIYPPGVSLGNGITKDIEKLRIRYVIATGGILDMIYTKID